MGECIYVSPPRCRSKPLDRAPPGCREKWQECHTLYRSYKEGKCPDLWYTRCTEIPEEELEEVSQDLEDCAGRRVKFQKECVDKECKDVGHERAIQRFREEAVRCRALQKGLQSLKHPKSKEVLRKKVRKRQDFHRDIIRAATSYKKRKETRRRRQRAEERRRQREEEQRILEEEQERLEEERRRERAERRRILEEEHRRQREERRRRREERRRRRMLEEEQERPKEERIKKKEERRRILEERRRQKEERRRMLEEEQERLKEERIKKKEERREPGEQEKDECQDLKEKVTRACRKKTGCYRLRDPEKIQGVIENLDECLKSRREFVEQCDPDNKGQQRHIFALEQSKVKCVERKLLKIINLKGVLPEMKFPPLKTKTIRTPARYLELLARREGGEIFIDEFSNLISFRTPQVSFVASGKGEQSFLNLIQVIADTSDWVIPIPFRTKEGISKVVPRNFEIVFGDEKL